MEDKETIKDFTDEELKYEFEITRKEMQNRGFI